MKTVKMYNANDGMKEVEYVPAEVAQGLYEVVVQVGEDKAQFGDIQDRTWRMLDAALAAADGEEV